MELSTKVHGNISYKEEDIISFKKGIPGFEGLTKFILFEYKENPVFSILHSIEDENIGLFVINPFDFFKEYEINLKNETIGDLLIESENDVRIINTITLSKESITTNLKAPIILNIKNKFGQQIILDREDYKIKQPLF